LARFCIGYVFLESGWGHITHLSKVIEFFTSLGIPAAHIQALFVSCVELIGGGLVFIGLLTRVACFPLIGTMAVAILTANRDKIHELSDLLFMPEFLFIVLLVWLIVKGAGALSVDHILAKRCEKKQQIG
jgi:putative oxidoreductase